MGTAVEVARKAGISRSSAYEILANPKHPCYPQATRQRVLAAAKEVGYVPHAAGRALRTRQAHTIGVLADKGSLTVGHAGGVFTDFLPGLCVGAAKFDYYVLVEVDHPAEPERNLKFHRELACSGRIDGIVIASPAVNDPRLDIFRSADIPIVVRGGSFLEKDFDTVGNDRTEVLRLATQHLLDLGHRRIVHLTGPTFPVGFEERKRGYREAMEAAGAEPRNVIVYDEAFVPVRQVEEVVEDMWSSAQPPTAVVADDDILAVDVVHTLQRRGLNVPSDVSVVGVNDSNMCLRIQPTLTSVSLNTWRTGEEAARLLISRIKNPGQPVRRVTVPCELIVRDSSQQVRQPV
ncbi:MAG: LacI family DNA-binding transcriptional regulator [Planctomycetota bacterium]|nr:LacI family DNA-binding transcriptional regulator [Planctomycetota bacterium]